MPFAGAVARRAEIHGQFPPPPGRRRRRRRRRRHRRHRRRRRRRRSPHLLHLLELVVGEAGLLEDRGPLLLGAALFSFARSSAAMFLNFSMKAAAAGHLARAALALALGLGRGRPPWPASARCRRRRAALGRRAGRRGLAGLAPWPAPPQSFLAGVLAVDAEQPRASRPRSSATIGLRATTVAGLEPLLDLDELVVGDRPASTSRRSKPSGVLTATWSLPLYSRMAWTGTLRTLSSCGRRGSRPGPSCPAGGPGSGVVDRDVGGVDLDVRAEEAGRVGQRGDVLDRAGELAGRRRRRPGSGPAGPA